MDNKAELLDTGKRIRARREELGLTREDLANEIGMSVKFVQDVELGNCGTSRETLIRLSKVLNISIDYILLGSIQGDGPLFQRLNALPPEKRLRVEQILSAILSLLDGGNGKEEE